MTGSVYFERIITIYALVNVNNLNSLHRISSNYRVIHDPLCIRAENLQSTVEKRSSAEPHEKPVSPAIDFFVEHAERIVIIFVAQ